MRGRRQTGSPNISPKRPVIHCNIMLTWATIVYIHRHFYCAEAHFAPGVGVERGLQLPFHKLILKRAMLVYEAIQAAAAGSTCVS